MGIKEIFKYRRSIVVWKILRNFSKKRENHKDDSFKEKIMSCRNQEISMDAVMNNLFLSKRLYDLLKVKCHPDRFIEPTQKESKRLLNYILCIRFFIEVHSIVSASRFFHMPTYLRVVIECQSRFFPFFPAFSRNCPDYFLHTSGSSSFRSLSDLGAR